MKLEWQPFSNMSSLVNYVNENDIKRENIQEIIEIGHNVILLYWVKK